MERLIGSIRRECLDHVVVLHTRHLRRILVPAHAVSLFNAPERPPQAPQPDHLLAFRLLKTLAILATGVDPVATVNISSRPLRWPFSGVDHWPFWVSDSPATSTIRTRMPTLASP